MTLTTPTQKRTFSGQGSLTSKCPPDKKLPTVPAMVFPYKVKNGPVSTDKAVLQPANAASTHTAPHQADAMCTGSCAETCPPSYIPPYLLVQNPFSDRLHQLHACSQSQTTPKSAISG